MRRCGPAIGASVVLLALTFSGHAQDRKEPAAAGPQDKIDLGGVLDSWYAIVEKSDKLEKGEEKSIGFAHELITRMPLGSPWIYTYDHTSEIDTVVEAPGKPGTKMPEIQSSHVRAHLDDTYTPVFLDRTDTKGATVLPSRVVAEENVRRIEVEYAGDEKKPFNVNPDEEIFYSRFLMFI